MMKSLAKYDTNFAKTNPKGSSLAKKDINWDFLPEFRPFTISRLLLEDVIYTRRCCTLNGIIKLSHSYFRSI